MKAPTFRIFVAFKAGEVYNIFFYSFERAKKFGEHHLQRGCAWHIVDCQHGNKVVYGHDTNGNEF